MTRQALVHFNVPAHEILQVASAIRHRGYALSDDSGASLMSQISEVARQLDFTWVGVPANSTLAACMLGELRLRTTIGVSVVGIILMDADRQSGERRQRRERRSRRRARHPRSDRTFRIGDTLRSGSPVQSAHGIDCSATCTPSTRYSSPTRERWPRT